MIKIILIDWAKNFVKSERDVGYNWFYNKHGIHSILQNMQTKTSQAFELILVLNDTKLNKEYDYLKSEFKFIDKIIYRKSNVGLDFGAYDTGYTYLKQTDYYGNLVFMNTACIGPITDNWLAPYIDLFKTGSNIGLVGSSYCGYAIAHKDKQFLPHIQSYFLFTNMAVMDSTFPNQLPYPKSKDKKEVIQSGEIEFSQKILNAGYTIKAKLDNFQYKHGDEWKFFDKKTEPKLQAGCYPFYI